MYETFPVPTPAPSRKSRLAIWSFILSLLGLLLCLPAIGGILLGIAGLVAIGKSNGALTGKRFGIAGLVLGFFAPFIWAIGMAVVIPAYSSARKRAQYVSGYTLLDARKNFATKLTRHERDLEPPVQPPVNSGVKRVTYPAPSGLHAAYLSTTPNDGKKHPAIVWIFGGFSNGIGSTAWIDADDDNDQSARAFRANGVITMYPALRGGSGNPGERETFYGEVDDILAATEFLSKRPGVDPARIYLGGHSTGGTMALLVAAASPRFRAVFAFGPVDTILSYGPDELTYSPLNRQESTLRNPANWIHLIHSPTYVFEGSDRNGNADCLQKLISINKGARNPGLKFYLVQGHNHFDILAPLSSQIARQIATDAGAAPNFTFSLQSVPLIAQ